MEFIFDLALRFLMQFQSPALAFLIGGILIAAMGSKLQIPSAIYQFAVFMLLMKIGMKGGMEIKNAHLSDMALPILITVVIGIAIVLIGTVFFSLIKTVKREDGIATAGLFGAVSASTLAAAMSMMEDQDISYEAWAPALYPFMDIPALILAIVLANLYLSKTTAPNKTKTKVISIVQDSLRSTAISALLLGMALGLFANIEPVFSGFYEPLFKGLLSILMLTMGMEAYARLRELKAVAHWFAFYAAIAPIIHGIIGFGLGYIAYITMGFSPGGVVILSILAASSSDVSGPPTLRAAIPSANPSCYIGASTSVGTPVTIAICIPMFIALADVVFK
jgi:hypothetical protein